MRERVPSPRNEGDASWALRLPKRPVFVLLHSDEVDVLGFWGFRVDPRPIGVALAELPDPPARAFAGVLLAVSTPGALDTARAWHRTMRAARPRVPLGLILGTGASLRSAALKAPESWTLTLLTEEFAGEIPPRTLLLPLLNATTASRVVAAWRQRYSPPDDAEDLMDVAARIATRGRGVDALARELGTSRATLERQFRRLSLPPPGLMLRQGRVAAFEIRVARGVEPNVAMELGGWSSEKARLRVLRRLGTRRLEVADQD